MWFANRIRTPELDCCPTFHPEYQAIEQTPNRDPHKLGIQPTRLITTCSHTYRQMIVRLAIEVEQDLGSSGHLFMEVN